MGSTATYSTLHASFELLYVDLTTIKPESFLSVKQICRFITSNLFIQSLPSEILQRIFSQVMDDYKPGILRIIEISLPCLLRGFLIKKEPYLVLDHQKGMQQDLS